MMGVEMSVPASTQQEKHRRRSQIGFLAVALVVTVVGYVVFRTMRGLVMLGYVDSAIARMRVLNTAEAQFAKEHLALGYTCELSELPETGEISRLLAKNNIDNGYAFEITGCHGSDSQKPNFGYYTTAQPLHSGQPAFCSDQSGVVKADYSGSVEKCLSNGVPL